MIGNAAVSLVGGLGFVPEIMAGTKGRIHTTVHGTAPKYADMDRANPCAMILAVAEMIEGLGEPEAAQKIVSAVREVLQSGSRTSDAAPGMGAEKWSGTMEFTDEVVRRVKAGKTMKRLENDKKPLK
jgi:isocitrate dehydrogenase